MTFHLKLVCSQRGSAWDHSENAGFDRERVIASLASLRARGHSFEVIDGTALTDDERAALYADAFIALTHAGRRYRIRGVYGSQRHGGGEYLGTRVPALLVYQHGRAVDVYPHQVDAEYRTIREFLQALEHERLPASPPGVA